MARLSRDTLSYHARSIVRRDARHDLSDIADRPSTGKKRSRRRGRCRDGHEMVISHQRHYYSLRMVYEVYRCSRCGKEDWRRGNYMPLPEKPITEVPSKFFPVHEEGTCAVCDERRKGG